MGRAGKRVAVFTLALALSGLLLESGARVAWHSLYNHWLEKQLHGFDRVDTELGVIVPIPGITVTRLQHRENLESRDKTLGLRYFDTAQADAGSAPAAEDVLFQVNRHGFKGPDFAIPKPASTYRILAIGDSCTWGPADDRKTYPRVMERSLSALNRGPASIEVVNAGVLGYNLARVAQRLDHYLEVDPDLVTLYIGWNRTIGRVDPRRSQALYDNSAVYRFLYHGLINRQHIGGYRKWGSDVNGRIYYDADEPVLDVYASHDFSHDIEQLDEVVGRIREHNSETRIVLFTLAGMFDERVKPDERALKLAYPITSTLNLHAYAILTRRWNEALRTYASASEVALIDFETMALEAFVPRSSYFGDSVHPTVGGYEIMGQLFAREIARLSGWTQSRDRAAVAAR